MSLRVCLKQYLISSHEEAPSKAGVVFGLYMRDYQTKEPFHGFLVIVYG